MPRKRSARDLAETSKPRQLRKRLRKAEDQLADAQLKRDRAQARVEALSIIADEIRAQLAEADKAAELDAAATQEAEKPPSARRKRAAGARSADAGDTSGAADEAPAAVKKAAAKKARAERSAEEAGAQPI